MRRETKRAFEELLDSIGGEGNQRFENILIAAIRCAPVREALAEAIQHYSEHYEDCEIK